MNQQVKREAVKLAPMHVRTICCFCFQQQAAQRLVCTRAQQFVAKGAKHVRELQKRQYNVKRNGSITRAPLCPP